MKLTSEIASAVVESIIERVGDRGAAVAVVDDHGELLAFRRSDACPYTSITIAQNKAYTAARERRPSKAVGEASATEAFPMSNFGDPRMVTWGGWHPHPGRGDCARRGRCERTARNGRHRAGR